MKVIIVGYGKMGKLVEEVLLSRNHQIVAHYGSSTIKDLATDKLKTDVLIDFSRPKSLPNIINYVRETGCPLVLGTTGYSEEEMKSLIDLKDKTPILYSSNYSLGIALFKRLLSEISPILNDNGFDVEIMEAHHNQKVDAPSGTAKALLSAIDANSTAKKVYGRCGDCSSRTKGEIGIHSVRGGTVAGEHTVMFLGNDEKLEIKHTAISRRIFANGAVLAAEKICNQENGYYLLDEIIL